MAMSASVFGCDGDILGGLFGGADDNRKPAGQLTPSFTANGTHKCQSATDIGHSCPVSGNDFNDCHEAAVKLKMDDCCPSTRKCTTNPDGTQSCRYGGSSIEFIMGACYPH